MVVMAGMGLGHMDLMLDVVQLAWESLEVDRPCEDRF